MKNKGKQKPVEKIFVPNEIFEDLINNDKLTLVQNRAFTYSYYYMISSLYRYCKYMGDKMYSQADIKEGLGYSSTNKKLDFIIKKDGVLDDMGYTSTTTDFPMQWYLEEDTNHPLFRSIMELKDSEEYSEMLKDKNYKNFKVKYPIKAFYRDGIVKQVFDGSFYDKSNTHMITTKRFDKIIETSGVMGFYVYGFIKYKSDKFSKGYQVPIRTFSEIMKMDVRMLMSIIKELESNGFVRAIRQKYVHDTKGNEANIYIALEDL